MIDARQMAINGSGRLSDKRCVYRVFWRTALRSVAIVACCTGGAPSDVAAQTAQREMSDPTVRGRADAYAPPPSLGEDRDATAIRVGNLLLKPRASVRATYDDNVDAEASDEKDDVIVSSEAGLRLQSNLRRHSFGAELLAGYDRFVEDDEQSDFRWGGQVDGRLDFTRTTRAFGALRYVRDREDQEEAANLFTAQDDGRFHNVQTQIGIEQELRVVTWSLLVDAERTAFDDRLAADRDRSEVGINGRAIYKLTEKLRLSLSPSVSRLDYDRTDAIFGFDRDETRYAVRAGVEFDATEQLTTRASLGYAVEQSDDPGDDDSQGVTLGAGFSYRASESLTAEFGIGYDAAQDSDLEDGGNIAISASGSLDYSLGTQTGLQIRGERVVEESDVIGANEEIASTAELRLTRLLTDTMQLTFAGGFTREEFDGIDRDDDTVFGEIGYDWAITDRVSLNLGYRFSQRESDAVDEDFTRNLVTIGLSTAF